MAFISFIAYKLKLNNSILQEKSIIYTRHTASEVIRFKHTFTLTDKQSINIVNRI